MVIANLIGYSDQFAWYGCGEPRLVYGPYEDLGSEYFVWLGWVGY